MENRMEIKIVEDDPWDHTLAGCVISVIAISGIILNSMLIERMYRAVRISGNVNILLISLVVANFGLIILALPFSTIAALKHEWIWGDFMCTYYGSMALLCGYGIMISTMMIMFDTFLEMDLEGYDEKKDFLRKLMVAYTWLNALFWAVVPLIGWSRIAYEPSKLSCTLDLFDPDWKYILYIALTAILFYVAPVLVIIYLRVMHKSDEGVVRGQELKQRLTRTYWVSLFFVLAWLPYTIIYIWPIFNDPHTTMPLRLSEWAPVAGKMSVVLTPLIFLLCGGEQGFIRDAKTNTP